MYTANGVPGSLSLFMMLCSDDHRNGAVEWKCVAGKEIWKTG